MASYEPESHLFSVLNLRGLRLKNRIVVSPMQQYSASQDGLVRKWHLDHLARLSSGGSSVVFTEALAVVPEGRVTHADLGIWNDEQSQALARIVVEIEGNGAIAGAQLAHSGRKGGLRRPWAGFVPLNDEDAANGEPPWALFSPTDRPVALGNKPPMRLDREGIARVVEHFAAAADRAARAGFKVLEVHAAHGYLIHTFLSPLCNDRDDEYGGDFQGRTRFALEIAAAVRSAWPNEFPLIFRLSCLDEAPGGWSLQDTIVLGRLLLGHGVDVIDCSSGGLVRSSMDGAGRSEGHRIPIAAAVRNQTPIRTVVVGGICSPQIADAAIRSGQTDLVALGRQMLWNPFWALQAACDLGHDPAFDSWPLQYGWWLRRRREVDHSKETPALE